MSKQSIAAATALSELLAGNHRFAQGASVHPRGTPAHREALLDGQSPMAVVFGCADSRLPPEMVFDQGLGDLFVLRTAGHAVDEAVLGSLEFAVETLRIPLLVILSHTSCGAVTAAVAAYRSGERPEGHLAGIIDQILPSAREAAGRAGDVDDVALEHVLATIDLLTLSSPILSEAVMQGRLAMMGAIYNMYDGTVKEVQTLGL